MPEWKHLTEESRKRWEENAPHWDARMGSKSNRFHNELVKPATEALLHVKPGERILDIACGNGNFSRRLCELGAHESHEGLALADQPVPHLYFHRPLEVVLSTFFESGFVLDGIKEPVFRPVENDPSEWTEFPPVVVLRFRKT